MNTLSLKEKIIKKLTPLEKKSFGHALNHIQDVAEQVFSKQEFYNYLVVANRDTEACDGQDGILLNGEYFDWREFNHKSTQIINAYLNYFTDSQLEKIIGAM